MDKRMKAIKQIATSYGFKLYSERKHLKWMHPSGAKVTTGFTISDRRAHLNIKREFKLALIRHEQHQQTQGCS